MNQAKREVLGFEELIYRFERTVSVLGRSKTTFENYSRHIAAVAIYYGKIPTELDQEQIHDYLFYLQKKSKTPSQSYFKHTVYGLRFLLNPHCAERPNLGLKKNIFAKFQTILGLKRRGKILKSLIFIILIF